MIGGGFAGASAARFVKQANPAIRVTLVEPNPTFTACPFSNGVIAGLRALSAQQFSYDKSRRRRRHARDAGRDRRSTRRRRA